MKNTSLLYLLAVLVLVSCKREVYPEPVIETPVFRMTGTVNGEPFSLNAGQEGLYMNSTLEQNTFGIYEFNCEFEEVDCASCSPVMTIVINDNEMLDPGDSPTPDVLNPGTLPLSLHSSESDFLSLHFHTSNDMDNTYHWDFGDGDEAIGNDVDHIYDEDGVYQVTLDVDADFQDHDVTITQTIYAGNDLFLSMPFWITNPPGPDWEFSFPNMLPPGLEILGWTINGEDFNQNHLHYECPDDIIHACLHYHNSILNEDGDYCVEFHVGFNNNNQVNDFINYNWNGQDLNIGKVTLHYRSPDGEQYTSATSLNDDPDQHFDILSVEDYAQGINGAPAKKLQTEFSIWMVNINDPDDQKHFENVSAVLGFRLN